MRDDPIISVTNHLNIREVVRRNGAGGFVLTNGRIGQLEISCDRHVDRKGRGVGRCRCHVVIDERTKFIRIECLVVPGTIDPGQIEIGVGGFTNVVGDGYVDKRLRAIRERPQASGGEVDQHRRGIVRSGLVGLILVKPCHINIVTCIRFQSGYHRGESGVRRICVGCRLLQDGRIATAIGP